MSGQATDLDAVSLSADETYTVDCQTVILHQALAAVGLSEDDLTDMADSLIFAYRAALAEGNGEVTRQLGHALWLFGHLLAKQLGPLAAGVLLS